MSAITGEAHAQELTQDALRATFLTAEKVDQPVSDGAPKGLPEVCAESGGEWAEDAASPDGGYCGQRVATRGRFDVVGPSAPPAPRKISAASGGAKVTRVVYKAPATPRRGNLLINFKLGSAQISDDGMRNARVFSQFLKEDGRDLRLEIAGHTDRTGTREQNLELSKKRAEAVKQFLVDEGVKADRLTAEGYGFDQLADRANPGSSLNRRVEARTLN